MDKVLTPLPGNHTRGYGNTYCEARFWRPTGLGNRLFSWARAKVFSQHTGCSMLSPNWAHLRGASILRGGIDYSHAIRKILLFDNFIPAPGDINGLKKIMLRRQCAVFAVTTLQEAFHLPSEHPGRRLISFAGHTGHIFDDLREHRDQVFAALKNIAKEKWHPLAAEYPQPFIGINVRMGNDFKKAAGMNDFLNNASAYLQTPLEWYVQSLRKTREMAGGDYRAIVVSDGTAHDLHMLLKEPNVQFSRSKAAIGDLLVLANAAILLGAGRSSFSAWASFLAKMPTITIPGSNLQGFHVSSDSRQHFVGEFDPGNPSEAYGLAVKNVMNV